MGVLRSLRRRRLWIRRKIRLSLVGVGGYDDVRYLLFLLSLLLEWGLTLILFIGMIALGITSSLIAHELRDARRLEGGRVWVLLRDRS